ncbi:MAG TPA: glycosyltransferase [Allocoleopsis sp.]
MKILFLTTILPQKQRMGSEVASQCFIDGLQKNGHEVVTVGYMRQDDVFELTPYEIAVDKRYIETKKAGKHRTALWLILSLWLKLPYSAAKYYSKTYIQIVKQLLNTKEFNIVIIDHPQLGWLEKFVPDQTELVTIAHNIEHEIYQDNAKAARHPLARWIYQREARLIKAMEDQLAAKVRQVWTLTAHDSQYFATVQPQEQVKTFALPPGLATPQYSTPTKEFDIGLIGSWAWKPNEEGLQWFLQQVYPLLPPSLSIHVAGRGAEWLDQQYPNIHYRGFVPNAQEFMAQAKAVAVPTLSGGGIQIKTLDAIASGSAIVATPVALRGISDLPPTVQIAEQAADFALQLTSTVSSASITSEEISKYSFNWCCDRQSKFLNELMNAVHAFKK